MAESVRLRDGVSLRLTRLGSGQRHAILVVPGIFMHRESPEHRLLAARLAPAADVITMDVRGHGDSGGVFSFGAREPDDVAEVEAFLRKDHERVFGLGFSFGGYHTCVAAALHGAFDAIALVGTPHRLFILDHNFLGRGLLRSLGPMARRQRRLTRVLPALPLRRPVPSRLIDRVAPRPVLIVHGSDDWLIPPKHAARLFAAAAEPKRLALIEGGLHAENMLAVDPKPLLATLETFFVERASAQRLQSDEEPV
ncbi:MAG TPA: alpha/beta fold hydrolase [Vicinamibacteria bacterium]|nr:alpha/beta fold hydrolase [Vicinamibacteria bacterium]